MKGNKAEKDVKNWTEKNERRKKSFSDSQFFPMIYFFAKFFEAPGESRDQRIRSEKKNKCESLGARQRKGKI